MACRHCPVPGCEVLIYGPRDICARHFRELPQSQQKRLDQLMVAKPGSPDAVRYQAELEASVTFLARKPQNTKKAMAAEATAPGAA